LMMTMRVCLRNARLTSSGSMYPAASLATCVTSISPSRARWRSTELCSSLRLAWVHFATPGPGRYWPSFGVDIDVQAAMVTFPGVAASDLHADEANTGVMLAIECWCANGCRGRLEFRQHVDAEDGADVVVLSLVETSPLPFDPDDIGPDDEPGHDGLVLTGDTDPNEPPF